MPPITPVMTFSPQTAAQASPFGGAQQSMFSTASSIKELAKQQLANKMMQEKLKTMPEMQQAQLATEQQKAPLMHAQMLRQMQMAQGGAGGGPLSVIGKTQYDIEQAERRYGKDSPVVKTMKQQRDVAMQLQQQRGGMFQSRTQTAPFRIQPKMAKQQIVEQIQGLGVPASQAAQVTSNLGRYYPVPGQGQPGQQMQSTPAQTTGPGPIGAASDGMTQQEAATTAGQTSAALQGVINAQGPAQKQAAQKQLNEIQSAKMKDTTTSAAQKAMTAGDRFETYKDQVLKYLPKITRYVGPKGEINYMLDRSRQATGANVPSLNDLKKYKQATDFSISESAMMMGIPAAQEIQAKHAKNFDIPMLSNNPAAYAEQVRNLYGSLSATQKSNIKTMKQVANDFNKSANMAERPGSTASMPLQVPTFNSKGDAQRWLASLSPQDRAKAMAQIQGGG